MEPITTIGAVVSALGAVIGLANTLFRPGETTKEGWTWTAPFQLPVGTRLRIAIDAVDDEVRATFNEEPLIRKVGRGEQADQTIVVRRGENKIRCTVANSGSLDWSVRANIYYADNGRTFFQMPRPMRGKDDYFPGAKINNRLLVWEFVGA